MIKRRAAKDAPKSWRANNFLAKLGLTNNARLVSSKTPSMQVKKNLNMKARSNGIVTEKDSLITSQVKQLHPVSKISSLESQMVESLKEIMPCTSLRGPKQLRLRRVNRASR